MQGILLTTLLAVTAGPRSAAVSPLPLECSAKGKVFLTREDTTYVWWISGAGGCSGDFGGPYFIDFVGNGTSSTGGLCRGDAVVQDLEIRISGTIYSLRDELPPSKRTRPLVQRWLMPVTTHPGVTPFRIVSNHGTVHGVGVFAHHLLLNCQGSNDAVFRWVQTT